MNPSELPGTFCEAETDVTQTTREYCTCPISVLNNTSAVVVGCLNKV